MTSQKKSKKNTPTEADQEDHHTTEDNGNFLAAEPSQTSDQERRAKLEALQKAQAEKTMHTSKAFAEEEDNEEDGEAIDRELERVQQKVQQLQKEKDRFTNKLEAKRNISEKLEKLNQAKEQIKKCKEKLKK
jgi:hypothetical protein